MSKLVWLTNCGKAGAFETRSRIGWPAVSVGDPKASDTYTVEQLKEMGMVGLYRPLADGESGGEE